MTLRWRALGPGPTTINASATVTSDNDINNGNNTQNATTSVISGANLSLAKSGWLFGGHLLWYMPWLGLTVAGAACVLAGLLLRLGPRFGLGWIFLLSLLPGMNGGSRPRSFENRTRGKAGSRQARPRYCKHNAGSGRR